MDYKEQVEEILTVELLKREPQASKVTVLFDGHSAVYRVRNVFVYRLRKLSSVPREFLCHGSDIDAIARL